MRDIQFKAFGLRSSIWSAIQLNLDIEIVKMESKLMVKNFVKVIYFINEAPSSTTPKEDSKGILLIILE